MSDERFFSDVKSKMHNYAPEVPAAVYSDMRRKLWWSNFTKLSVSRFNMWYLILLIGAGSAAMIGYYGDSAQADRSAEHRMLDLQMPVSAVTIVENEIEQVPINVTCSNNSDRGYSKNKPGACGFFENTVNTCKSESSSTDANVTVIEESTLASEAEVSSESVNEVITESNVSQPSDVKNDVQNPVNSKTGTKRFTVTVFENNTHK